MNINRNRSKSNIQGIENNSISSIVFDIVILDYFCKYVLTDSRCVRKAHLINMQKVIDFIDPSSYENDIEKVRRYRFIKFALSMKLERHLDDPRIIVTEAIARLDDSLDFIDIDDCQLSMNIIEWVDTTISETLSYSFIYDSIDKVMDVCTRFKATDYAHRGSIVKEFETLTDELKDKFRRSKTDSMQDMTFSLREDRYQQVVEDVYNTITSPSRRLITGMQGFNDITGGGLENQRVYMLFGLAAAGKSFTLLNIIMQIKKWNAGYKTKDPTKTPCIVLLTMENSVVETVSRLFSMVSGSRMNNYSIDEVLDILKTEGKMVLNDESPIDIVIKYKPNRSVDTNYLYTMVEDLEDDGYEVILLVQDHIKRIRSVFKHTDLRIELGEVVNEFKSFAIAKDIPVLSDSHLNREASKILENLSQSNKNVDAGKQLGKSSVSESFLMVDNLDFGANINVSYDEYGNKFMEFNVIKKRDDNTRDYIAQPFVSPNSIRFIEDLDSQVPVFKETLHESNLFQPDLNRKNVRASSYSDISALDSMFNNKKENNIFEMPTKYSNMTPLEVEEEEDIYNNIEPITLGAPSVPAEPRNIIVPFTIMNEIPKREAIYFW